MESHRQNFLVFYSEYKQVNEFIVLNIFDFLDFLDKNDSSNKTNSKAKTAFNIDEWFKNCQCKFPMTEFDSLAKCHATDPRIAFVSLGKREKNSFSFEFSYCMSPVLIDTEQKVNESTGKKSILLSFKGLGKKFNMLERSDR